MKIKLNQSLWMRLWCRWFLSVCLWCVGVSLAWANDAKGGFVWQVTAPNQTQSYLIGTIHLGKEGSVLPKNYQQALQKSRLLVLESQESDWEGMGGAARMMALQAMMADKQTLAQKWGLPRIRALNQILEQKNSSVRLDGNAYIASWAAYMMMVTDYTLPEHSMEYGIDALLIQQAQQQKKAVLSLETIEPMALFMKVPEAVLVRSLDAYLKYHEQETQDTLELLYWYHAGESQTFVQATLDQSKALRYYPKQDQDFWRKWLFDDLLVQRNLAWIPKIERHFKQQPTTVAVGAAHLFGQDGLIVLLRERGFKVESVKP